MASIYGAYSKYTRLRIDYTVTQNKDNNTSTINMTMFAERTKASQQAYNPSYYSMTGKEQTAFSYNWSASSYELEIGSSSIIVKHNDDGTATTTLEGYWNTRRTGSSYIPQELWISQTITLPTIARKSQVGLHPTDITLGNSITIYTNRQSTTFTHTLYWQGPNGVWNTIATNVTDSYSWNTSNAISNIATQFPNSSRGNITIICETYNNGTYIGSTTAILNFTISSQPTVSNIATSGGINGAFIEDVSSVTTNVTASGIYGSSISSYRVEMYNGSTKIKESYGSSSSASFTLSGLHLSADANITLKATIIDTRGNSGTTSTTINIKHYYKPQITRRNAHRVNSSNEPDTNGTRLLIYWAYSTKSISGVTTDTAIVQYRKKGDSTWTPVTVANDGVAYVDGISTDYQYEVQFSISDGISAATVITDTVPTGSVTVDYRAGGKGIAFGKVSEKNEFECNMVADFKNTISWESASYDNTDYNTMKKAGIYYMVANCTNGPGYNYLRLLVMGASYSGDVVQIASSVVTGRTWIRGCSNDNWHKWIEINQIWHKGINDNFNNFTETGIYICGSTPTGLNRPISITGVLEVINNDGLILQRYTTYEGSLVFQRGYYSSWTVWKKVAGTIMKTYMLSARTTVSGEAWTKNIIPLDAIKTDTSIGLLPTSNSGIKIGNNINTVKISASISFYNYNATGEVDLHILKNSEVVASAGIHVTVSNQIMTIVTNPLGINVSNGDVIYLSIIKNTSNSLTLIEGTSTSLTVEAIN